MVPTRMMLGRWHERCARFYREESVTLGQALSPHATRMEHIGSSAVPDLLCKPVVDIGVTVADLDVFPEAAEPLELLGYRYRGQHGPDALRRYLVLDVGGRRVAQLHVWAETATGWHEAVAFRDLLRRRPDVRSDYAREKRRVAHEVSWDKGAYSVAKGAVVSDLLDRWVRS